MRGGERVRKKRLQRAGWGIVSEERAGEHQWRLVLLGPGGQELSVDAPTRPRAFQRAETLVRQRATTAR
jgi:hypothetical protein